MSHIVEIKTQVKDRLALAAACRRMNLSEPVKDTVSLFVTPVTGWTVRLPEWRYPVVFQIETGETRYDNYGGRWGDPKHLDRLLQLYAVEKATLEARRKGHSVMEQLQRDGSIKLTIQVGGAA